MTTEALTGRRMHYFMASVQVLYTREGDDVPKSRTMNIVLMNRRQNVAMSILNDAKQAVKIRAIQEMSLAEDGIMDIVFLNIFHLGQMTEKQFENIE